MSSRRKSPLHLLWRSVWTTCHGAFHCVYSALVLLLALVTAFATYVATLDYIPVPKFLVHELRERLQAEGLALEMRGILFQPNGRIAIEQPLLRSTDLGSPILSADQATVRIRLSHLLLRRLTFDELSISAGEFIIPAMLTPSGLDQTAISSIHLEARLRGERWNLHYANLSIDQLRVAASGNIKSEYLRPKPKPDEPEGKTATQLILEIAPKIARLQKELTRLSDPNCILELDIGPERVQQATVRFSAKKATLSPEIQIERPRLAVQLQAAGQQVLGLQAESLALPKAISTRRAELRATWEKLPSQGNWMPIRIESSLTDLAHSGLVLPNLFAKALNLPNRQSVEAQFMLAGAPWQLQLGRQDDASPIDVDLIAQLGPGLPAELNPIASDFAQLELSELAQLGQTVDLHLSGKLSPDLQPQQSQAIVQAGAANIKGAKLDRATILARYQDRQIDVEEIWIRSGLQSAKIGIGYNLDTRLRRILLEGNVDPTMINGWFKPWWAGMWEGMVFSPSGMYAALDSQAIFKRPETVRVTGIGLARDMDLRGLQTEELRTRFFSLFHYVDLYDIELDAIGDQTARGEVQFSLGHDIRDAKDKLTGLWIDVDSTLDIKIGPSAIWEIGEDIAEIIEPYDYETPPRLIAKSYTIRQQDEYDYAVDLDILTNDTLTFYGFPFESVEAFAHIRPDIVEIPGARGTVGGGRVEVDTFILGDGIDLDLQLTDANFGQTLVAANAYFAADGSETAQEMDLDKLLSYGGNLRLQFSGQGIVGESTSYTGKGNFDIKDAAFGKLRLFGLLSAALEATPLRVTTLKFADAQGDFEVDKELVRVPDGTIDGPVAGIKTNGAYNLETDQLDFRAKLFPFRNSRVPLISPLINLPLNVMSHALEVTVTGAFSDPKLSLFTGSPQESTPAISTPKNR